MVGIVILWSQFSTGGDEVPNPGLCATVKAGSIPPGLIVPKASKTVTQPPEFEPTIDNLGITATTPQITETKPIALHTLD